MPKLSKPLTDTQVKDAKGKVKPKGFADRTNDEPTEKSYPLADGEELYLHVSPDGSKYWRMQCLFAGKQRLLSFGKDVVRFWLSSTWRVCAVIVVSMHPKGHDKANSYAIKPHFIDFQQTCRAPH